MSEQKHRMAVFDLDGTLLDTTEGILAAIRDTVRQLHLPTFADDVLQRVCIGPPVEHSFAALFGLQGQALADACHIFRTRYATFELTRATPYAGIFSLLHALRQRGLLIGVATYKREAYALPLLTLFGFTDLLDVACGTRENETKAAVLARTLQAAATAPAHAVMIGDTVSDAEAALAVGTAFIGVTYGFGFSKAAPQDGQHALAFVKKPADILPFFTA